MAGFGSRGRFRTGGKKCYAPVAGVGGPGFYERWRPGSFYEQNWGPRIESALEADLCRMIGIKYFGILLYDRSHERIRFFAEDQLAYLDFISGHNLMMFVPSGTDKTPPHLKSLLDHATDDVIERFQWYMKPSKPFDPDACFIIAESLGLKKSVKSRKGSALPCVVFFRVNKKSSTVLGFLQLRDRWFPASKTDTSRLSTMRQFFQDLFGELDECISNGDRKTLERFRLRLAEMKRSAEWKRCYMEFKDCAIRLIHDSSRRIIKSLPSLIERSVLTVAQKNLGL